MYYVGGLFKGRKISKIYTPKKELNHHRVNNVYLSVAPKTIHPTDLKTEMRPDTAHGLFGETAISWRMKIQTANVIYLPGHRVHDESSA